MRASAAVD